MNTKDTIPSFPTSITQNTSNTPTTPSSFSAHHRTWKRYSFSSWHSFSTVFLSGTNLNYFMVNCSFDLVFSANNTSLKLLFTTQWSYCISRSYTVSKFVVIFRAIVILENCIWWWTENTIVIDWLFHSFTCYCELLNSVAASLSYSLHSDTPSKPIRGDASSLSSID